MKILEIKSSLNTKKQCTIQVTEEQFNIQGDFYYLVNKEFRKSKSGKDCCSVKEYMGLGTLRKRSPKKTLFFLALAVILEFVNILAGKISDFFFFANTDWTAYIVNVLAIICLSFGAIALFSKKHVIEISFLSKRICVDAKLFTEEDITRLQQLMVKLR